MTSLLAAYASSDEEGGTPPPTSRPRLTSPPREPATADEEAKARADAFNLGGLERRSDAGAGGASTSAKEELVGSAAPDVLAEVGPWFLLERVGVGGRRGKVEGGRAGRERVATTRREHEPGRALARVTVLFRPSLALSLSPLSL